MTRFAYRMALGAFLVMMTAPPAAAQVVGCSPVVLDAMKARAQAQMAYDIAVTNEMIDPPDSVLNLTCFSNAAGVSASAGGSIFSGDFTAELNTIMPTIPGPFSCAAMTALWTAISNEGVNTRVPYATFDNLMTGVIPAGAGADYTATWTAPSAVARFAALNTAVTALNASLPAALPDFTPARSSCRVLFMAGVLTAIPPGMPCP